MHLKNFKQHEDLVVDFGDGLNVITGPNYSGKTTLLEAVNFALWGVSTVPGGSSVAMRRGANKLAVDLHFRVDGETYRIRRTQSGATLYRGDEEIAKSQSVVSSELERLLGISKKRFMQLKYGQQSETKALLTLGAPELHRIIEDLSGVEVVNRVLARATSLASHTKALLEQLPEFDTVAEELQASDLKKAISYLKDYEGPAQVGMKHRRHDLADAGKAFQEAHEHNQSLRQIKQQRALDEENIRRWDETLSDANAELKKIRTHGFPKDLLSNQQVLRASIKQRMDEKVTQEREFLRADAARQRELDDARRCETDMEKLGSELAGLEFSSKDLENLQSDLSKKVDALAAVRQSVSSLEAALKDASCPRCKRPFEDHNPAEVARELEAAKQEQGTLSAHVKDLRNNVADVQSALTKAGQQKERLEQLASRRTAAVQAAESHLATLTSLPTLQDIREDLERHRKGVDEACANCWSLEQSVQREADLLQVVGKGEHEVKRLQDNLAAHPLPERGEIPEDALHSAYVTANVAVNDAVQELNALQTDIKLKQQAWSNLQQCIQEHTEANQRRRNAQDELATVQQLQKYLRDNRDRFVAGVWAGLLQYASAFVSTATGGFLSDLTRSDDGEFLYTMDDFEMPVAAASGAQKSIMGIAVQAALAQLLPSGFHCVMLDEPTADMDPDHALAVSTLLSGTGGQCLMVSHRELDSSIANHCIQLGVQ
jgi:exonuclease SbcC